MNRAGFLRRALQVSPILCALSGCGQSRPAALPRNACTSSLSTVTRGEGGVTMSGTAPARSENAEKKAFAAALVEGLASVVGVRVEASFEDRRSAGEVNGKDWHVEGSEMTTRVQYGKYDVRDFRASSCATSDDEVRVDVFIPRHEIDRLVRERSGITKAYIACASEIAGICTPDLLSARIKDIGRKARLMVSDVALVAPGATAQNVSEDGRANNAARALLVELNARPGGSDDSLVSCRSAVSATLFDTSDGKSKGHVVPKAPGSDNAFKGTAYKDLGGLRKACELAVKTAFEKLERAAEDELAQSSEADGP